MSEAMTQLKPETRREEEVGGSIRHYLRAHAPPHAPLLTRHLWAPPRCVHDEERSTRKARAHDVIFKSVIQRQQQEATHQTEGSTKKPKGTAKPSSTRWGRMERGGLSSATSHVREPCQKPGYIQRKRRLGAPVRGHDPAGSGQGRGSAAAKGRQRTGVSIA